MYLRYIVSYRNNVSGKTETGIFHLADHIRDHSGISDAERVELQEFIMWFD